MTDPIADMLTRIRNATLVSKEKVVVPYSKLKYEILKLLEEQGWIKKVKVVNSKKNKIFKDIEVILKYGAEGEPVIKEIKRISRPGRRVYKSYKEIKPVLNGFGMAVISTSLGLMTDKQARKRKIGGEILFEIS
ncbi:30S ribosomal protein S8 [bacterium]|nr:30S ribosomal protein S8 [bacterium]